MQVNEEPSEVIGSADVMNGAWKNSLRRKELLAAASKSLSVQQRKAKYDISSRDICAERLNLWIYASMKLDCELLWEFFHSFAHTEFIMLQTLLAAGVLSVTAASRAPSKHVLVAGARTWPSHPLLCPPDKTEQRPKPSARRI